MAHRILPAIIRPCGWSPSRCFLFSSLPFPPSSLSRTREFFLLFCFLENSKKYKYNPLRYSISKSISLIYTLKTLIEAINPPCYFRTIHQFSRESCRKPERDESVYDNCALRPERFVSKLHLCGKEVNEIIISDVSGAQIININVARLYVIE